MIRHLIPKMSEDTPEHVIRQNHFLGLPPIVSMYEDIMGAFSACARVGLVMDFKWLQKVLLYHVSYIFFSC